MVSLSRFDNLWSATMRVEVLYFDGCPTYRVAEKTLRGVLAQEDVEAEVELVAVNSDEEVQRLRFPGSPTIRVDSEDLFPVPERAGYALGCRMYATPEGLRGSPTIPEELSRDARLRTQALRADRRGVQGAAAERVLAGEGGRGHRSRDSPQDGAGGSGDCGLGRGAPSGPDRDGQ